MAYIAQKLRPWRKSVAFAGLGLTVIVFCACSGKENDVGIDSGSSGTKLDTFCSMVGLPTAMRETTIIVDATSIVPSAPEDFREKNPELFKLVVGLADPSQAIESGAAAPRERITILAGSAAKGTLSPVFTGCLPGASVAELAAIKAGGSENAAKTYFGSDIVSQISKQQGDFTRQILLALGRSDDLAI